LHEYELVTILSPEIKDEDVAGTIDRINQFIATRGGEVQNTDQWGRRKLAYPIARQFEGTYVVTLLRLPPTQAVELEANLSISEDILRHLLVRCSSAEAAAALAASQRRRPQARPEDSPAAAEPATGAQPAPEAVHLETEASVQAEAPTEPDAAPVEPQAAEAEAQPEVTMEQPEPAPDEVDPVAPEPPTETS